MPRELAHSTLCFLLSMLLAFSVERDRFQLWSFQLTRVQLCSSQSLQEKELARSASTAEISLLRQSLRQLTARRAYSKSLWQLSLMAQFHDRPTRARELEIPLAQLCFANPAWLKAFKPQSSTRAYSRKSLRQLTVDQLDVLQESGFQTGALQKNLAAGAFQESAKAAALETSFAAGAFDTAGFTAAAPAATASASCITSSSSPSRPRASAAPPSTTTTTTTNFSRKRVDELEETNNFAAMGQELAKYIANLREICQKLLPKTFRELEVIKDNFPQKPDIDACQVELGNSELDVDACQVELGNSELDLDACQVELSTSQLDTENFDQLTLKEPLRSRRELQPGSFEARSFDKETSSKATSKAPA